MLENALRMTVVLEGHRFTLISAISSTNVNGRGLVWLLEELREGQKRKIKLKMNTCYGFTTLSFLWVCFPRSDTKPILYQVWMKSLTPLTLDWLWWDFKEIPWLISAKKQSKRLIGTCIFNYATENTCSHAHASVNSKTSFLTGEVGKWLECRPTLWWKLEQIVLLGGKRGAAQRLRLSSRGERWSRAVGEKRKRSVACVTVFHLMFKHFSNKILFSSHPPPL